LKKNRVDQEAAWLSAPRNRQRRSFHFWETALLSYGKTRHRKATRQGHFNDFTIPSPSFVNPANWVIENVTEGGIVGSAKK